MTNKEQAQRFRKLADRLEVIEDGVIDVELPSQYFFDKVKLAAAMRALGGAWDKKVCLPDSEHSYFEMVSRDYPIRFSISRNAVCKKIVTFDCEPIFSPQEEKELLDATD